MPPPPASQPPLDSPPPSREQILAELRNQLQSVLDRMDATTTTDTNTLITSTDTTNTTTSQFSGPPPPSLSPSKRQQQLEGAAAAAAAAVSAAVATALMPRSVLALLLEVERATCDALHVDQLAWPRAEQGQGQRQEGREAPGLVDIIAEDKALSGRLIGHLQSS